MFFLVEGFMLLVFLLYALFASVFTICKVALQVTEPLFLIGSRMVIAGALLLAYQYYYHPLSFTKIKRQDWIKLTKLAAFNIYLTNACEFWGLQYLSSFKTCFIYSFSPFLSALFSYFLFSEHLSKKKWLGLGVGFLGFLPILLNETTGGAADQFAFSLPELAVMVAAISSVYGWIVLKQIVTDSGHSPMIANGFSMTIGGAMALFHSAVAENWSPVPVNNWLIFMECALALIVISNLVCYNLYGYLLQRFSATFMSFAGFTTPLFAAFFGWFFLGEMLTWPFYVSAGIVFLGLLLFYQEELKKEYFVKSPSYTTIPTN